MSIWYKIHIIKYMNKAFYLISFLFCIFLVACEPEYTIAPFFEGIYKGRNESITEFIVNKADTFARFRDLMITGNLDITFALPHIRVKTWTRFSLKY